MAVNYLNMTNVYTYSFTATAANSSGDDTWHELIDFGEALGSSTSTSNDAIRIVNLTVTQVNVAGYVDQGLGNHPPVYPSLGFRIQNRSYSGGATISTDIWCKEDINTLSLGGGRAATIIDAENPVTVPNTTDWAIDWRYSTEPTSGQWSYRPSIICSFQRLMTT